MSDFSNKEGRCLLCFSELGPCFHLWTPENFEIIFRNADEFRFGMGIMAVVAKCFPNVRVITFELMTNHLHIMAAGDELRLKQMFAQIKKLLMRMAVDEGRTIDWTAFKPGVRQLNDISDAKKRFQESSVPSTIKNRRSIFHSHISDGIQGLRLLDGYFSPFSFCDIAAGESLFRDAVHYFYMLSKNIESNKEIAKEIGESVSYTEDELYAAVSAKCRSEYGTPNPAQIPSEAKIAIAKAMRYEYNATLKQIQRMLRVDQSILQSIFGSQG